MMSPALVHNLTTRADVTGDTSAATKFGLKVGKVMPFVIFGFIFLVILAFVICALSGLLTQS